VEESETHELEETTQPLLNEIIDDILEDISSNMIV
jgi:hypothetical protein